MKCKNGHIISGAYCSICEEKPPKKKVQPIKKESKKLKKNREVYGLLRLNFLALKEFCEVCGYKATEIHHKKGREGDMLNDINYWMAVCRGCHVLIHDSPSLSYKFGYLIKRSTND